MIQNPIPILFKVRESLTKDLGALKARNDSFPKYREDRPYRLTHPHHLSLVEGFAELRRGEPDGPPNLLKNLARVIPVVFVCDFQALPKEVSSAPVAVALLQREVPQVAAIVTEGLDVKIV